MGMEVTRTAIVPVDGPAEATEAALHSTARQYYSVQNATSDYCWPDRPKQPADLRTDKRGVRDETYADHKADTDLHANLVQAAIEQTVENVGACKTNWRKGRRCSQPTYDPDDGGWTMLFDARSGTFRPFEIEVSLVDGSRHTLEFVLPDDLDGTPYAEYVLSGLFDYSVTRITYRTDTPSEHDFFAHIVSTAAVDPVALADTDHDRPSGSDTSEYRRVLGVDRNVDGSCAVTSAGGFYGNADYLNHRRTEYERVRGCLQETGTRSAHLTMGSLRGREWRWFDELAHHVANGVCADAYRVGATHVVFEDLEDIRDRISNLPKFQQWFFDRIRKYVTYKLAPYNVEVCEVDGAYTSQACSRTDCPHACRENRSGKTFACEECGYELDADLNAAKNVAYRYIRETVHGDGVGDERWFDVLEMDANDSDSGIDADGGTGVPSGHMSRAGRAASQPAPVAAIVLKSGLLSVDGQFARRSWPTPTATSMESLTSLCPQRASGSTDPERSRAR